jgi:outer membrane protein
MNGGRLRIVSNVQPRFEGRMVLMSGAESMRLFDELAGIKHALVPMHLRRMLCAMFAGVALAAAAQEKTPSSGPAPLPPPQTLTEARRTRVLTMEEVIRMALEHNLSIQITRYTPMQDLYALYGNYSPFEPVLKMSATHSYNSSPAGTIPGTSLPFPPNIRTASTYAPDLSGTLPTGLTYDLNAGPLVDQSFNFANGPPKFESSPGITLRQPILKNFWTDNNRFQISLSKNLLHSDEQSLRLTIMTTITSVKTAYYNLIGARENVEVNVKALELAEQLVAENLKRVQLGALAPLDEKQSESQAATSKANLLASEQALNTAENTLKNLITDNFSYWAEITPVPSETLVAVPESLNLQESWRRGVTQRPEMVQARLLVEKQNITIRYNYNQLFPEVDLTGSYGRNAADATFTQNLGDIRTGNNPFYSYGVAITIPLEGNIASINSYKSSKAALKQSLLQLKQQEQTIVVAIDNDVKTIRSDLQQVDATREARIYAEAALEAEQIKLEHGKSTSFVVLQLQSNLTTARSAEITALANYNIALEQLAQDEGNTLERNHIDVNIKFK